MGSLDRQAEHLAALSVEAEAKRSRLMDMVELARMRVRPSRLASEAGNKVLDAGLDAIDASKAVVRSHPFKAAGIAAAVGAILARKPLLGLAARGYARLRAGASSKQDNPTDAPPSQSEDQ